VTRPFYITTAISYPNGKPHVGHAYEAIAADAVARYHRLAGADVFFMTGTDEYGLKMAQAAHDQGVAPMELADANSAEFRRLSQALNISHDRFIRTTEGRHAAAVQALWRAMDANGDIYLDRYEGWYSVRDEAFYAEDELIDGPDGARLSPQGTPVEWTTEESYFFRLSAYADRLLAHYDAHPGFIQPASRRNEVLSFVRGGLRDLSISRTSFDWGVPVPGAPGHVMYVWVDALTNYLTATGYPGSGGADTPHDKPHWPAQLHVIGKDVVRFHTVYWPAFLMSAGLLLPETVFGHGFVLNRGEKMGKSAGNAVDPFALAETYGVDQLRYFLLREVVFGQDGSYSPEAIVTRTNAELANSFGNLAQRVLSLIHRNLDGVLPAGLPGTHHADDIELLATIAVTTRTEMPQAFELLAISAAIEAWTRAVYACNHYVDAQAPWALKKTDPERMGQVLATLFAAIRSLAIAISPVIPASAARLLDAVGVPAEERDLAALADHEWYERLAASGFRLGAPVPIFPRLDAPAPEAS